MKTDCIYNYLVNQILALASKKPLLVAIDGIDGAGKSTFAAKLFHKLQHNHPSVIHTSIDYFHNPKAVRYKKVKILQSDFTKIPITTMTLLRSYYNLQRLAVITASPNSSIVTKILFLNQRKSLFIRIQLY